MEERARITTPESVDLDFEIAGLGSRMVALFLDTLIWWVGIILLYVGIWLVLGRIPFLSGGLFASLGSSVFVLAVFLIRWGYYIFFETRLRGQTPGKKLLGIRVMRDSGLPLGFRQSLIRNLLRIIDMLPLIYLVAGVSALATKKGQRLGDIAAGTFVIRERFRKAAEESAGSERGAGWMMRLEQGKSQHALVLPGGTIDIRQIALIEEFLKRCGALTAPQRWELSWQIARPLLPLFDRPVEEWEKSPVRQWLCESFLQEVVVAAHAASAEALRGTRQDAPAPGVRAPASPSPMTPAESEAASSKARTWSSFISRTRALLSFERREMKKLSPADVKSLLVDYRRISTDLARAQSMGADPETVTRLNRMAIGGHSVIYGHARGPGAGKPLAWLTAFPREIRANIWAVLLSAFLFFIPALISAIAVQSDPRVAYELVGPDFYDFKPADEQSLHRIPQLMRPVAASRIMTNNLQIALLAFAGGLTLGLGSAYLLISNGIYLGAVIGWFGMTGNARALWGWIMPHGGTEIIAIIISAAAGMVIAGGILVPGRMARGASLRLKAQKALVLELGCLAMLVVAAIIEGFVSPSHIPYALRIVFLAGSVLAWIGYFALAGTRDRSAGAAERPGG